MSEELETLNNDQKLKLTTYYAVSKACDEIGRENTLIGPFTVSKESKELITEFLWKKMDFYAEDLEAFANHAKRSIISAEDVKLLFRRNSKLLDELAKVDEEEKSSKSKKRKRPTAGVEVSNDEDSSNV